MIDLFEEVVSVFNCGSREEDQLVVLAQSLQEGGEARSDEESAFFVVLRR